MSSFTIETFVMTADPTGLMRAHKQPHFLFSVIFDCTGGIFNQPRSDAPSGITPLREVERVNYRKDAVCKFKQVLKHKCSLRWRSQRSVRRADDLRHKLTQQLAQWPLKKAVMLYLTLHKPTHFLCYHPFIRGLQKSITYVTILQTSLQRTWFLTVQYLFHFQFPFPERSPSETSTNVTTREKQYKTPLVSFPAVGADTMRTERRRTSKQQYRQFNISE